MGPKKPLYIMNLAIDSNSQKKVYIFEDTDPWKKAYQFVETNNLEDEMVPLIADLIESDKRKYLANSHMSTPNRQNYKEAHTPSTAQMTARPEQMSYRPNEISGRGARQPIFEQVVMDRPPLLPAGGGNFTGFHMGQRPNILDSLVDSQGDWSHSGKSGANPAPVATKMQRTNSQPNLATGGTPGLMGSSVGYSPDSFYLKESGPVQTVVPHIQTMLARLPGTTAAPALSASDSAMMQRIFSSVDVEQRGVVKSFEVSLSPLPRDLRTLVGGILRTLDEQGQHNGGAGFASITYEAFVRAVLDSGKMELLRNVYSKHTKFNVFRRSQNNNKNQKKNNKLNKKHTF